VVVLVEREHLGNEVHAASVAETALVVYANAHVLTSHLMESYVTTADADPARRGIESWRVTHG
jgi:hypothetical protein